MHGELDDDLQRARNRRFRRSSSSRRRRPRQHVSLMVPYRGGHSLKKISAAFYRTAAGAEPVRDWLKGLSPEERREIGQDIATVEYGWPVGMPVCRPLGQGLWRFAATSPETELPA